MPLLNTSAPSSSPLRLALALSLGAAVSLGITRFAYGLLLPPMRADLGWSYTLAGAMNTANAAGYLLGALITPALLRRWSTGQVLLGGVVLASVFMALTGFFTAPAPLLAQRVLAGTASALVFIAGGLLAARLGAGTSRAGLLLGVYYGGVGWGIAGSALVVPVVLAAAGERPHAWAWAWWVLAAACAVTCAALAWVARRMANLPMAAAAATATATATATVAATSAASRSAPVAARWRWRDFAPALAGYAMFGVGYIGYMTFVVALLREQGVAPARITLFYALLGVAVLASPWLWARVLDRWRDGRPLALLNALLGAATLVPALTTAWPALLASGIAFGAVFLSVVASTTALVRHNLPATQWPAGISAFTLVFAAGQIVGPSMVGWIADGPGGLARGLLWSAGALWVGAGLALGQRGRGEV